MKPAPSTEQQELVTARRRLFFRREEKQVPPAKTLEEADASGRSGALQRIAGITRNTRAWREAVLEAARPEARKALEKADGALQSAKDLALERVGNGIAVGAILSAVVFVANQASYAASTPFALVYLGLLAIYGYAQYRNVCAAEAARDEA